MATGYYVNNPAAQAAYLAGAKSAGSSGASTAPSNNAAQQLAKATSANTGLGSTTTNAAQGLASASAPSTFGGSNNAPSGTTGVRTTLNSMGFPNQDIGWNGSDVTLSGPGLQTQYINPDANENGTTYASPADISSAATATGWQPQQEQQINDLVNSLVDKINQPFSFNQSTSPQYQAATAAANSDMNAADNQTMQEMNSRGLLPSTITAQALQGQNAQIYNDEVANLLPNMESQAYQEYQGGIGNTQNAIGDISSLQSTAAQQQLAQATLAMNQQRYGAEETEQMENAATNELKATGVVTPQISQVLGIAVGTPSQEAIYQAQQLQIAQQNANNGSTNANTAQINASTNAGKLALDQEENSTKTTDAAATSSFTAYLLGQSSPSAAEQQIQTYANNPAASGIDWVSVYKALAAQWPATYGTEGTGSDDSGTDDSGSSGGQ